ncbi:hypothetical protein Riv7116_4821 [Rivularia sp. PCC 7116]|uniref:hypothetical protein n=1 Tax=Rivularia sp. PCC 7116 TaxID=373994 RepID=UPI00029EDA24|nr:hypothetical protein [Rivularia sp. PCC 7116]AFY57233.1 hypothetical protein Riv7116_4821 [Rivularia sp. PCC 7116]
MSKVIDFTVKRDEKEIRRLIQKWIDVWNVKDKPFTGKGFEDIFAAKQISFGVVFNFELTTLHSLQQYIDTFVPIMEKFSHWEIKDENDLNICVDNGLGVSSFCWFGCGKSKDGEEIKLSQDVIHNWVRFDNGWRLVKEHLSFGKFPKSLL